MNDKQFQSLLQYVDGTLSEPEKIQVEELLLVSPSDEYFVCLSDLVRLKKHIGTSNSLSEYLQKREQTVKQLLDRY